MRFSQNSFVFLMVGLLAAGGITTLEAQTAALPCLTIDPQTPRMPGPAAAVLKMVQAGVETNVVMAFIDSNAAPFGMSVDDILDWRAKGVSSEVITAMLRHDAQIIQLSRITPPLASVPSSVSREEDLSVNLPPNQADSVDATVPQVPPEDQELAPGAAWISSEGSGRHGRIREGAGADLRRNPACAKPTVGTQAFPAASIPGTVPLVQPTVPLVQPVVPLVPSPSPIKPMRPLR